MSRKVENLNSSYARLEWRGSVADGVGFCAKSKAVPEPVEGWSLSKLEPYRKPEPAAMERKRNHGKRVTQRPVCRVSQKVKW